MVNPDLCNYYYQIIFMILLNSLLYIFFLNLTIYQIVDIFIINFFFFFIAKIF